MGHVIDSLELNVSQLTGGYGGKPVIHDVSLRTVQGITGLIGSNGAGKTTTLRLIAGLLHPDGGRVCYGESDLTNKPPDRIAREGIILVPEGRGLFPTMSAEENLLMGAFLRRARKHQRESMARVYELFPSLRERRSVIARRLSGGEQQMLAIGRGLVARPRLLILDEPSLGLAPALIEQLAEAIQVIARDGVSILLCEQNAAMTLFLADYVFVMEHGSISVEGTAEELRTSPEVTRAYLGAN